MDADKANAIKSKKSLRPSQALRSEMKKRGAGDGTITYFYSAKNDRDLVLPSDLQFALALLLDADETVKSWESDPDRVIALVESEGYIGTKPDAIVTHWSGRVQYVEAKYKGDQGKGRAVMQAEAQQRAAESVGADWSWFSEEDVEDKESLLHSWIHIAPVLCHTKDSVKARWEWLRKSVMDATKGETTLGQLRSRAEDPWDLVFSATFRLVQLGLLRTNLLEQQLSPATVIARRERRGG